MKRQKRFAFTLVELLVVIAILAVLIAILLPSLANARRAAGRVACSSNMHQAALAFQNYANSNKGKLPSGGVLGSVFTPGGLTAPTSYNPATKQYNGGAFGALISAGFMPGPHAFKLQYDPGAQGGEMTLNGLGSGERAHYWWNPHPANKSAPNELLGGAVGSYTWPNTPSPTVPRWEQMSQIKKGRILGCDVINGQGSTAHKGAGRSTNASWNLAYPDTHVSTVPCPDLFVRMKVGLVPPKGPVTNRWDMANDAIRVLELIDQGKNPRNTAGNYWWDEGVFNKYYPPCTPNQPTEDE